MVEPASNDFLTTLNELQGGATVADLNQALQALVGDVRSIGKPGTLTLTLKVSPKASGSQLIISDEIKLAPPKPDREITIMFADDNNHLTRRDPRQPKLDGLQSADVRSFPIAVNHTTGEISE